MALNTYGQLKAVIADYLDRQDLADQVDDFIDLAEARHRRDIRIREMLTHKTDYTIAEDARYVAYPTGYLDIKSLRVLIPNQTTGRRYFPDVDFVTVDEMADKSINTECRPHFYTLHEQLELDSPADQEYTAEILFYDSAKNPPLDDGNTTNVVFANHPDAYLYAALSASAPFLMNDERIQVWEAAYTTIVETITSSELQNRYPGRLASKVQNLPQRRAW